MEVDWNAIWREQLQCRLESSARDCADIWKDAGSARRYLRAATENNAEYFEETLASIRLEPFYRVLDIGAGPGVMAIHMAGMADRVTAVEPAKGMADILVKKCREQGRTNVTCIRKRWEDIDPRTDLDGPYNVIVAAFSLGMMDLEQAIRKMILVARGRIYLFWFAGTTDAERLYRDLWPLLHQRSYCPGPKANVLYNLLYQMGIYPHLTVFPYRTVLRFASLEEAVTEFAHRLRIRKEDQGAIVKSFLENRLQVEGNDLIMRQAATCVKFWWDTSISQADTA